MKLAVMQPYLFPYIGYFQLINAVDRFVIYDDVNFIKGGWINRNRVLVNGVATYLNAGIKGASSFKLISEIELDANPLWRGKMLKTIKSSYGKAPHFSVVFEFLQTVILYPTNLLADFLTNSIVKLCDFIGVSTDVLRSSQMYQNRNLRSTERVLDICRQNAANTYINAIGGKELYRPEAFRENNIELKFLQTRQIAYQQFSRAFVPNLSIIDVLMFNSREKVSTLLSEYDLV